MTELKFRLGHQHKVAQAKLLHWKSLESEFIIERYRQQFYLWLGLCCRKIRDRCAHVLEERVGENEYQVSERRGKGMLSWDRCSLRRASELCTIAQHARKNKQAQSCISRQQRKSFSSVRMNWQCNFSWTLKEIENSVQQLPVEAGWCRA